LKKYEAILILDDRKVEGNGSAFVKDVETVIAELGGTEISSECMGRKQFSYPIKKKNAGTYWDIFFTSDESTNKKLLDRYRLSAEVLRLVIFVFERPEKTQLDLEKEIVE
jgi:ribosomal protein S6